jgi:alpha-glucosidase
VQLLATPSKIADTSWIKPGKSAWDWWNGWAVNVPDAGINTASYKAYIDFAKSMDLDYILIDEGWYKGSSEGAQPADVTVPVAAMDMPGIVKYGADRHVGVWVWLQWKQLERQMDAALALYEAWGIKGIKVDFMDRNDQQMVAFYHELLSKAAAHHLMVDLHGAYPPDGLARTWPNFLTQEGVLGAEYNKFGTRITATHNVTLPSRACCWVPWTIRLAASTPCRLPRWPGSTALPGLSCRPRAGRRWPCMSSMTRRWSCWRTARIPTSMLQADWRPAPIS